MITDRHLKVFYEVCKHMNMTKASRELYISQPAVSKTIHDIEEEYKIKLFERWNKALYLTPDGAMLFEYAEQVVNMLDVIDKQLQSRKFKDLVRVGASITVGTSILGDIVAGYCAQNDAVRIEAVVDNTAVIEEYLLQGKLDLAIMEGRITSLDIKSNPIGSSDIVLVVNCLHELYARENVVVEDLEGLDFIVREKGSRTRESFAMAMEQHNVKWNAAWSCHNTQAIKNAVDAGLGVGVLSRLSVRKRLASGRFRALDVFEKPLKQHMRIAFCQGRYMSQSTRDFMDYTIKQIEIILNEKNS